MDDGRIRPFSNGTQRQSWYESNCFRCSKSADELPHRCDVQEALDFAYTDDGTVSASIARRMGVGDETRGRYTWPCGEVQWTPEWKAEWRRRHPEKAAQLETRP